MSDVIYHDRPRESARKRVSRIILVLIVIAALIYMGCSLFKRLDLDMNRQAREALTRQVTDAAVQCYAIEGSYPADVSYLELNYGLRYDASRFKVELEYTTPDDLPEISVIARDS